MTPSLRRSPRASPGGCGGAGRGWFGLAVVLGLTPQAKSGRPHSGAQEGFSYTLLAGGVGLRAARRASAPSTNSPRRHRRHPGRARGGGGAGAKRGGEVVGLGPVRGLTPPAKSDRPPQGLGSPSGTDSQPIF